jgi:hypothetical protein
VNGYQTDRLIDLANNLGPLGATYRKLVAEIVMLRLCSLMELAFESITVKVLCGAGYLDGSAPLVVVPCRNKTMALTNMLSHGRSHPLRFCKWNQVSEIRKNVQFLLGGGDTLLSTLLVNNAVIEEMRHVRNHIAHNVPGTRAKYAPIVRSYYGAALNSVTPGVLLLSPRQTPLLLLQYITKARIIIKDLVRT